MSDIPPGSADELIAKAMELPYGGARVNMLVRAVNEADFSHDADAMFLARMHLSDSAILSGQPEKAIPAIAWCLQQFDTDFQRHRPHQHWLLASFKNVLHNADEFPRLSLDQFEELRARMAALYRRCGYNMRPVHYIQFVFATAIGDRAVACKSYEQFRAEPRDDMADCEGCEADSEIEYYDLMDEPARALDVARPSLEGQRKCLEVPHRTLSLVLRPLALLGRYDEADLCQERGYELIWDNPAFLRHVALQIAYLVHRNRLGAAVRMVERHLWWALETHAGRSQYHFFVAARIALARFADVKSTCRLNLPQNFPMYDPSGNYDVARLLSWFGAQQADLGKRFDSRNGNDFFSRELVDRMQY